MGSHLQLTKKSVLALKVAVFLTSLLVVCFSGQSKRSTISAAFETGEGPWLLADSAWPTAQYNFQRTGRSPLTGIVDRPAPSWERQDGFSYAQLTVGISNTLYVKSGQQTYTIELDGRLDQTGLPRGSCRSAPVHMNNGIIIYGGGLNWWAINSRGDIVWTVSFVADCFHAQMMARPDGVALFGYGFGLPYLYGVDGATGTILWGGQENFGDRSAISSDGTIYSALLAGGFNALSSDGQLIWAKTDIDYEGGPAIGDDGTIYIHTYDPNKDETNLRALDPNGSVLWDFPLELRPCGFGPNGPAVGLDGTIYIGAGFQGDQDPQVYFYAVNPDGTLKWRFVREADPAIGYSPPVCVPAVIDNQDNVYFCDVLTCHAFTNEGERLWSYDSGAMAYSTPVIADNGLIVMPTQEGVMAIVPAQGVIFMPFLAKF